MSFGYAIGDFVTLAGIALSIVQNTRKACGAHDSLTREVNSLHIVLNRLQLEVPKPDSLLNSQEDNRKYELATLAQDCRRVLRVLSQILEKYNALSEEKRSVTKLWQRVRFGNGEMLDLENIRSEVTTYTQAITLFLNMLAVGSQGKVEKFMDTQGEDTRELKRSLNWITARMQANDSHGEKSILTSYSQDDKLVWKEFRRELVKEGFSSRSLGRHKDVIKQYVLELGKRGLLDETLHDEEERAPDDKSSSEPDIQESQTHALDPGLIALNPSTMGYEAQEEDISDDTTSEPEEDRPANINKTVEDEEEEGGGEVQTVGNEVESQMHLNKICGIDEDEEDYDIDNDTPAAYVSNIAQSRTPGVTRDINDTTTRLSRKRLAYNLKRGLDQRFDHPTTLDFGYIPDLSKERLEGDDDLFALETAMLQEIKKQERQIKQDKKELVKVLYIHKESRLAQKEKELRFQLVEESDYAESLVGEAAAIHLSLNKSLSRAKAKGDFEKISTLLKLCSRANKDLELAKRISKFLRDKGTTRLKTHERVFSAARKLIKNVSRPRKK